MNLVIQNDKDQRQKKVPGIGHSLLFMVIFAGVSGTIGITAIVLFSFLPSMGVNDLIENASFNTWLAALGNSVGAILVLKIGHVWSKRPWQEIIPLKSFNKMLVPAMVLFGIGASFLMSDADNLLKYFVPMPSFIEKMMLELISSGLASFIVLVIIAPLTEETVFRGLIFNGLLSRYSGTKAIVISAIMFSLFHLNPYQMVNAFILGLVLGWLRLKTGSLWPCLLLHALSNGLVFIVELLPFDIEGYNTVATNSFQPWWLDLTGLALVVLGMSIGNKGVWISPGDRTSC